MKTALVAQLQDLRVRAGSPSVRDIERLVARQGRQEKMARSTIQAKLSGQSSLKLGQVLCLVEALAEHARLIGSPLSPQEIDQGVWRERVVADQKRLSRAEVPISPSAPGRPDPQDRWPLSALHQAGMLDVAEIVVQSKGTQTATWLPRVAGEMLQAQMSCKGFMKTAAYDQPLDVVKTVAALHREFPRPESDPNSWGGGWSPENSETVLALLSYAARVHGAKSAPVIVVGLRRAGAGEYVGDFLKWLACWHLAAAIEGAVVHLRAAELARDALGLLQCVGADRRMDRTFEVAAHFDEIGVTRDRDAVLQAMACDRNRLVSALRSIVGLESEKEMRDVLMAQAAIMGDPTFRDTLKSEGFGDLAHLIPETNGYPDEPPF
ncbi:hypothetical protein [Streptomyces virginiae]